MCNDILEYRPYRSNRILSVMFAILFLCGTVLFGLFLNIAPDATWLWGIIAFLCGLISWVTYDASKILVLFELNGIHIIGDKKKVHIYLPWTSIKTVMKIKSYRGFQFFLLAPKAITCREAKRLVIKGGMRRLYFDGNILLYVDEKHRPSIEAYIFQNIHSTEDGPVVPGEEN